MTAALVRILCALVLAVPVAGATLPTGPPPGWVDEAEPDVSVWQDADGSPTEFLLYDSQVRVGETDLQGWVHFALRLTGPAAVESNSQIEIGFDPTYQRVALHRLRVIRDGQVRDLLGPGEYDVLEQGSPGTPLIYDERRTLVVVPRDLRPGDVLEYAYTRDGKNPVFGEHFSTTEYLGFNFPVRHLRFRLVWDRPGVPVYRLIGPAEGLPGTETLPGISGNVYVWDRREAAALDPDDWTPLWWADYPQIGVTDCADWDEVRAWGRDLFAVGGRDAPSVLALADSLAGLAEDPVDRVDRALRFVQDEIRYVGIEVGVNSHLPRPPDRVLANRYGDCKDKSLLLVALLDRMGIEAAPALVATWADRGILERQPGVNLFDHVIVHLDLSGKGIWVDPTRSYQRGSVRDRADFAFGAALVLDDRSGGLTEVPTRGSEDPLTTVVVEFRLGGYAEPVPMEVVTVYRGSRADEAREWFASLSPNRLTEENREYYSALYPDIEATGDTSIEDDEAANLLTVRETYSIPGFWTYDEEEKGWVASFEALELYSAFPDIPMGLREAPLHVTHPSSMHYEIQVYSDSGWQIEPESETWTTPAADLSFTADADDTTLHLAWDYRSRADHVEPRESVDHLATLENAQDHLVYSIIDDELGPTVVATRALTGLGTPQGLRMAVLLGILATVLLGIVAIVVYRSRLRWPHDPSVAPPPPGASRGRGGWVLPFGVWALLLLPACGWLLTALWRRIAGPVPVFDDEDLTVLWRPWLAVCFAVAMATAAWGLVTLIAFLRERRSFPVLWMGSAVLGIGLALAAPYSVVPVRSSLGASAIVALLGAALLVAGIAYLGRSERVRRTFRHPIPVPPPPPAQSAPPPPSPTMASTASSTGSRPDA